MLPPAVPPARALIMALGLVACASARSPLPDAAEERAAYLRAVATATPISIEVGQQRIRDQLKDPAAAQFDRMVSGFAYPTGEPTVCGRVNAKNSYGGYVGFDPFILTNAGILFRSRTNGQSFDLRWFKMCRPAPSKDSTRVEDGGTR